MKSYYKNINMKITDGPEYRPIKEMPGFAQLTVKAKLTAKDGHKLHEGRIDCTLLKKEPHCLLEKGLEYAVDVAVDSGKIFLVKIHSPAGG
ncbi:MAG: hypothetical protein LBK61_01120 [Spirochaetaceae bacterium]|nr:hypothetical protein [Spirochaetaceae bacterium]